MSVELDAEKRSDSFRLLSITDQSFRRFANLLYEQQGSLLMKLSQALEPALIALVTGSIPDEGLYPIEYADVRMLELLPKGAREIVEHLQIARPE